MIDRSAAFQGRTEEELAEEVVQVHSHTPSARLREVMYSFVTHLHAFMREVRPTSDEWMKGIRFLTDVGRRSDDTRDEYILLSDVLGVSTLMEMINSGLAPGSTPGTVLGPYYSPGSPKREFGASVIENDDGGEKLRIRGVVRDMSGKPIPGATVDVWSCASNGLYPAQDPAQSPTNLRGVFTTNDRGEYEFVVLRPANYSVPTDGPVGDLLKWTARPSMRSGHVHLIASAQGCTPVTTHIFDSISPYLATDAVFSTDSVLVREFKPAADGMLEGRFDIVLSSTAARTPPEPVDAGPCRQTA